MQMFIHAIPELKEVVKTLLDYAGDRRKFVLSGEIGAGKTTLVQAVGQHLQVRERITSPTFSLVNEYSYIEPGTGQESLFYHIDLYRIKDLQEALDIGIEDFLKNESYCFIEWPEVIEGLLPEEVVRINIELADNSSRKILFL